MRSTQRRTHKSLPYTRRARADRNSTNTLTIGATLERCIFCASAYITRRGKRYKQHEILQRWYCHSCAVSFSPRSAGKDSTYPLKIILETLCHFYQGHTIARTADYIRRRFGLTIHPRTITRWLSEYRDLTTFVRLRDKARQTHTPHRLIRSTRLHHKQVYTYRIHHGKLDHITGSREHHAFQPIADYLTDMAENCPHHLFQSDARASQGKAAFNLDAVEIKAKRNHACRIAELVLQTVTNNKRRHDEIQRFMLITDSVTVAVEVPIILTLVSAGRLSSQRISATPWVSMLVTMSRSTRSRALWSLSPRSWSTRMMCSPQRKRPW